MKAFIISAGFIIGFILGFWPGVTRPKPFIWRLSAFVILAAMITLALLPHTAGSFKDAAIVGRMDSTQTIPVMLHTADVKITDYQNGLKLLTTVSGNGLTVSTIIGIDEAATISGAEAAILNVKREGADNFYRCESIAAIDPTITLPYIIGLGERARNLYFHVPMSWIAILAYIYALVYGIKYLSSRNLDHDIHSSSAAALGTVFCILATATGSIWAKFNWGSFWNWDPRQTSIFVLLLIYAAYFALRSSIENEHQRAKLSSAYSIIGGVSAIFFVYIAPRLYEGLHPGAAGDKSIGPVLSPQAHSLNHLKQIILKIGRAHV